MQPSSETRDLLTLLQWPRVGPVTVRNLLAHPKDGSLLNDAALALPNVALEARLRAADRARQIIDECAERDIIIVGLLDRLFPALLRRIPDPPVVLYVKGDGSALTRPGVAVVGTRKASESGGRIAEQIAGRVADRDLTVVSGLALGIDTHAHVGALAQGGTTVAVLAHGLDTVAPASNKRLADQIVHRGGALVSEHPPGTPPRPPEFVRRNRLQSGMSWASVIVESDITGGAMHQARFTVDQHRRLFTVLAATSDSRGDLNEAGARRLIEEFGAIPIRSVAEWDRQLASLAPPEPVDPPPSPPKQGLLEW